MTEQTLASKAQPREAVRPYKLFNAQLVRKELLSPHMCRLTFTSDAIEDMCTHGPDQRIKLFFPDRSGKPSGLPDNEGWQAAYQALSVEDRPVRRTYTIRALRADEVDIDFVLHGDESPASRWAIRSNAGDPLQIVAPDKNYVGDPSGFEWAPSRQVQKVLVIGDETALPAIAGILETLASQSDRPDVAAFIEVPTEADCLPLSTFPELTLTWLPRNGKVAAGSLMMKTGAEVSLSATAPDRETADLPDIDLDKRVLWERASAEASGFYAWVAGETAAVKAIRKLLIQERGLDRSVISLMGYWRQGREMG